MAMQIRFWRGDEADMPLTAPSGVPMWCEDTQQLWVGTGTGRRLIGPSAGDPGTSAETDVMTNNGAPLVTTDGAGLTYAGSY